MLIRVKVESRFAPGGRQEWPQYHCKGTEMMLDAWENDDCIVPIARAFNRAPESFDLEAWNAVHTIHPFVKEGQGSVRIMEDPDTGYIYYRRPIDIERAQLWNENRSFRISAEEW